MLKNSQSFSFVYTKLWGQTHLHINFFFTILRTTAQIKASKAAAIKQIKIKNKDIIKSACSQNIRIKFNYNINVF